MISWKFHIGYIGYNDENNSKSVKIRLSYAPNFPVV